MTNLFLVNAQPLNTSTTVIYIPQTGAGALISFEQNVAVTASGALISFEQVVESSAASHLQRTGWDLVLTLDNEIIPGSKIHGQVKVTRTESAAALLDITLIPSPGVQDIDRYAGAAVKLDAVTAAGRRRLFTGVVDIPEIDIIQKKITLRCTDKRTELINSQLGTAVKSIGYFSTLVFGEPESVADELESRLTTVPYAVDFDPYGNYTLTQWAAKATADYTLSDSDVFYDKPQVLYASRGRVTNQVSIDFGYRYERLHHTERLFQWTSPIAGDIAKLLIDGYTLTFRDMVRGAVQGASWPVKGGITFTDIWPSGWYELTGYQSETTGPIVRDFKVAWSTVELEFETVPTGTNDSNGNPIYEDVRTGGTDFAPLYCMGASWTATTRWAQNFTEKYSLVVKSPQSQAQYGVIEEDTSIGIASDYDASEWEDYTVYTSQPAGAYNYDGNSNYYVDKDTNRVEMQASFLVSVNRAKTTILSSHRDTRVIVRRTLWPEIDLTHTVLVDTDELVAKGKVFKVDHYLDVNSGEAHTTVTLILSRAAGSSVSETAQTLPAIPVQIPNPGTGNIILGNHFGQDPTTPAAAAWNGMIGNRWTKENNNIFETNYTVQFIVDVPPIPDSVRVSKELPASKEYNINVPNDTLIITF